MNQQQQTAPQAIRAYLLKAMQDVGGMKALFLDKDAVAMLSLVLTQSQILEKEVFLFRALEKQVQTMKEARDGKYVAGKEDHRHLKAIVVVRPTQDNVKLVCELVSNFGKPPEFEEFFLCKTIFSF
jgi:vacuolar protein sorting-associated protein 45